MRLVNPTDQRTFEFVYVVVEYSTSELELEEVKALECAGLPCA